jgi:hypothetical protein
MNNIYLAEISLHNYVIGNDFTIFRLVARDNIKDCKEAVRDWFNKTYDPYKIDLMDIEITSPL